MHTVFLEMRAQSETQGHRSISVATSVFSQVESRCLPFIVQAKVLHSCRHAWTGAQCAPPSSPETPYLVRPLLVDICRLRVSINEGRTF
jgi:hypothetical protein